MGDRELTLDYFEKLSENYQQMIDDSRIEVLTLDGTKLPEELAKEASEWVEHKIFERALL